MRFAPPAAALALIFAITASGGIAAERAPDPRAAALLAEGEAALAAGDTQGAIDAFEAALTVDPGYSAIYIDLAKAARADGLQGKAIKYYREAQERDPDNFAAISGEGEALVEKGAVERARQNLVELQDRCGVTCVETITLAATIERGAPVLTAEASASESGVTQN